MELLRTGIRLRQILRRLPLCYAFTCLLLIFITLYIFIKLPKHLNSISTWLSIFHPLYNNYDCQHSQTSIQIHRASTHSSGLQFYAPSQHSQTTLVCNFLRYFSKLYTTSISTIIISMCLIMITSNNLAIIY